MMKERRIANRECRPSRVLGCTWGEWGAMGGPILLIWFNSPPLLFGAVVSVLIIVTVLTVHRRFPPGTVADWIDTQKEILLHGHQRAGPRNADTTLRDGGLSPLDRVR
jgi:hypothetical protein